MKTFFYIFLSLVCIQIPIYAEIQKLSDDELKLDFKSELNFLENESKTITQFLEKEEDNEEEKSIQTSNELKTDVVKHKFSSLDKMNSSEESAFQSSMIKTRKIRSR